MVINVEYVTFGLNSVKKITSQNVWPRTNSNYQLIKTARSAVSKKRGELGFFCGRRQRNFENTILVARRRMHFRALLATLFVTQLSPKRGLLVHKNSLASYQQRSHSVKPRALTCPFKQSNLSAWSYPNP